MGLKQIQAQLMIPETILNKIRPVYVKSIAGELSLLSDMIAALAGDAELPPLKPVYRVVHNLTSGGVTYGFPDITLAGKQLEVPLLHCRDERSALLSGDDRFLLCGLLTAFKHACEESIRRFNSE